MVTASGGAGGTMASAEHRILVVDDEKSITDLVTMALHLHGVTTEVAHTGAEALRLVRSFHPHLVVLDVMLPDLDGFAVLEQMGLEGQTADVPVLFLTARGDLDDRLRGLSLGGDDYMTKPFSVEEMLLRINAILRRAEGYGSVGTRLTVGDLELDEDSHQVWRANVLIELTPTEFRLLHYLMVNAGQVVSKAQIRDRVWDYSFDGKVNMVEVYVSYLRKKLDVHGPPLIRTVRGIGYCMRSPDRRQTPPGPTGAPDTTNGGPDPAAFRGPTGPAGPPGTDR
jgi:two-component system OmpR family response regulator